APPSDRPPRVSELRRHARARATPWAAHTLARARSPERPRPSLTRRAVPGFVRSPWLLLFLPSTRKSNRFASRRDQRRRGVSHQPACRRVRQRYLAGTPPPRGGFRARAAERDQRAHEFSGLFGRRPSGTAMAPSSERTDEAHPRPREEFATSSEDAAAARAVARG